MYDYDPQKVSMSRLRLAYALNDHEVEIVMAKLWPHALFPLELWHKTHDLFWNGFANSVALFYSIKSPEFPEPNVTEEKYFHAHLYAQEMENLFSMLASRIHLNALREGFRYILSMTYENTDEIVFKDKMDLLFERLSIIEENNDYKFTQRLPNEKFTAIMEEKIFSFPSSRYFFISKMYPDTILIDTISAIRLLDFLRIPFKTEVKGITRALVDSVINSLAEETPGTDISPSQPQAQDTAPRSTGSRKDTVRIEATSQACKEIMAELLMEKQAFENDKDHWKHNLIFDNGKTNWTTFISSVETRLGSAPHIDTARKEWRTVPGKLKHNGRMPEQ